MRKIVLSFLIAVCSFTVAFGQDSIAPPTAVTTGPKGISAQVKKRITSAKDRLVIDLCMMNAIVKKDGGVTVPNDFKLGGFNRGINVYFMYDVVLGKKTKPQHFSIAPELVLVQKTTILKTINLAGITIH